ncbi:hypothetical protein GE061_011986 [Apolygus lucorum]|uniref:Phospholipase A2-like domain-containing protein n=1 Tax=Apolygus lucorum TaxID=248454 RepID=A0A8S9XS73_APOLU|nr:hypothetical protein GE061_011986 [Apolygus lucorum]
MSNKKERVGHSLANKIIDKLPIELHLPASLSSTNSKYQYCGPGTRFVERKALGQRGINLLDSLCYQHDQVYQSTQDNQKRYEADKQLEWNAWSLAKNNKVPLRERLAAWLVVNAMKMKTYSKGAGLHRVMKRTGWDKVKTKKRNKRRGRRQRKTVSQSTRRHIRKPISGGFLPLLLGAMPFFTAIGSLLAGGASVAKSITEAKRSKEELDEIRRHNKSMEEARTSSNGVQGEGLFIRPYKGKGYAQSAKGKGLYIRPYKGRGVGKSAKGEGLHIKPYSGKRGGGVSVKIRPKN